MAEREQQAARYLGVKSDMVIYQFDHSFCTAPVDSPGFVLFRAAGVEECEAWCKSAGVKATRAAGGQPYF